MAGNVKQVGDRIMDGDEALVMPRRLDAFHDPFPPSDWLVGIRRPIVQAFVRTMRDTWHDLSLCRVVGSKLISDHHPRCPTLALQQPAHQASGCLGIAIALNKNLKDEAVLIDGTPQPVLLATDRNHSLIRMPFIAKPAR